ncbi:MAG: sensor domain-containing diguanylate cyclase [Myxococcota bacterium]|nr:sensor domain-containing diguanylate cyclase [Myxococcota bacterium]
MAFGLAGWCALLYLSLYPLEYFRTWHVEMPLILLLALCVMARFLTFKVFGGVSIALDSAFYISGAFIFGLVPAAWLMVLVLTADGIFRALLDRTSLSASEQLYWSIPIEIIYKGGLPAFVLLSLGFAFNLDGYDFSSSLHFVWLLPAFSLSFLGVHYFLAGGPHWLQGEHSMVLLQKYFSKVFSAELNMIPLALAMVWGYFAQGFELFALLGGTSLVLNLIFRRAVIYSNKLRDRVKELATLNKVGHLLASSLENRFLINNIAKATLGLVKTGSGFMLVAPEGKEKLYQYHYFDEKGERLLAPEDAGKKNLAQWVMQERKPLLVGHMRKEGSQYLSDGVSPACKSWLGVPMIIHDEVIGVLAVFSQVKRAYSFDHLRVLTTIADQAALALENARLYELATIDGLTGLFVRRYFDQRLAEELLRSERYGSHFVLGLADLDDFKQLNDSYGHQAGDVFLKKSAAILQKNMRDTDLAARYGGEEFAFILPRTHLAEAQKVAERMCDEIANTDFSLDGKKVQLTISIGLAGFPESGDGKVADVIARADKALYLAKREGKNRVLLAPRIGQRI